MSLVINKNEGNEGAMLTRPTESVLVESENSSRGGTYDQQQKHPLQDAETSECQQDAIPGEYWTGHDRVGEGQIRCDVLRGKDIMSTCVGNDGDSSPSEQRRWTDIPKDPSPSWITQSETSVRYHQALQEFVQHTLVTENPLAAVAEVDEALVAFFNEKILTGVQQFGRRHSAEGNAPLLSGVREARGHFLPRSHHALQV